MSEPARSAGPAVEVAEVSKRFRLELNRPTSIKEAVLRFGRRDVRYLWALRDVSLAIDRGSFFGLVGHNGSGKSTLLRLMAGIHRPHHRPDRGPGPAVGPARARVRLPSRADRA